MKFFEICTVLLIVFFKDSDCDTNCGGEIRHLSGKISSPYFPTSYPDSSNCGWTFFAPDRQVVYLRFLHLDLASSYNSECADSITVHDGSSTIFPVLATLCGSRAPEEMPSFRFRSSGNTLHVKFTSDSSGHNSGFDANFNMQECPPFKYGNESCDKSCNCVQTNTRHCNSVNGTCACKPGWTSADCSVDINECNSPNAELCPENYQQCVNTDGNYTCECKPGMVKSSIGRCEVLPAAQCTLKHCSHSCAKLPTGIEQCYCPRSMMLEGNTCKDCPRLSYGNDCRLKCDSCYASRTEKCDNRTGECVCSRGWTGTTCDQDINECTTAISNRLCQPPERCINTMGSYVCKVCNQVFTTPSGEIKSPNYPGDYDNNLNCSTLISIPNKMATITVTLFDTNMESCCDFVSIFDGPNTSSPLIVSFSGYNRDVLIRSTQNNMLIQFLTDGSVVYTGFHGTYVSKEIPGCGSTLSNSSGVISGRNYIASNNDIYFCYWNFVGYSNKLISLSFTNLELGHSSDCSSGYLQVFNGTYANHHRNVVKYCAHNTPSFIRSAYSHMTVFYIFNGTGVHPKIDGTYDISDCNWKYGNRCESNCICDGSHTSRCNNLNGNCECYGGFHGANCSLDIDECTEQPSICSSNLNCQNTYGSYGCLLNKTDLNGRFECYSYSSKSYNVYITGPPNTVVSLSVSNFDMNYGTLCYTYMDVYDGSTTSSRQIGHYCGSRIPKLLRTTQNGMLLVIQNYSGRELCHVEYQIEQCPYFKYGPACSRECPCLRSSTKSCDNLYGVCECKSGWTGSDCSIDIDECQYIKNCTLNSECRNTPGSYNCECRPGYEYDTVTKRCLLSQQCPEQLNRICSHACSVINGVPKCACPENLVLADSYQCVAPFYTPFGEVIQFAPRENNKKLDLSSKVPMGNNKTISSIYVTKQGVILFDNNQTVGNTIHLATSNAIKLAAPLWTKYNPSKGNVSYHLIESCKPADDTNSGMTVEQRAMLERAAKTVSSSNSFYGFEVKTLLVVTWQELQVNGHDDKLTFQAVYFTGYEKQMLHGQPVKLSKETSHIMFIYQKGRDTWSSPSTPAIGITTGHIERDIMNTNPEVLNKLGSTYYDQNLDQPGVMLFNAGHADGPEQKCEQYLCQYSSLKNSDVYQLEINDLYKCPCSLDRLGFQWELYSKERGLQCFAIRQGVKTRLLPRNQRNKLCCYNVPTNDVSSSYYRYHSGGHILIGDPWPMSSNRLEALKNIEAHTFCCSSSSNGLCTQFYQIFPEMTCSNQVTFVSPFALGDPHISTLDGLTYPMNGWGEYKLLEVPSEQFMLQARTARVVSSKGQLLNATVFVAFAVRQGNESSFQVELALTNTTMNIYVDKEDVTVRFYKDIDFKMSTNSLSVTREMKNNKTVIKAVFTCGVSIEVNVGMKSLDIMLQVDAMLKNKTRGLMGNFNGDKNDEFQLLNGTVLPANSTERNIFQYFVKSYEISASTTIFQYEAGESNKDFHHPEFVPMFLDELSPQTLNTAKAFCGVENIPCIYDYVATNDISFAKSTKDSKNESLSLIKTLANKTPVIKSFNSTTFNDGQWVITKGKLNSLQVVAEDEDGDAIIFVLEKYLLSLHITQAGLITYTPGSVPEFSLEIKVKDIKEGYSATHLVPLAYCSGCNGHGTCTTSSTLVTKGIEKLMCQCYPAYTGKDCESEFDACSLSPCQSGRVCTDLSAVQQGNSSIGYTCGSCPAGLYLGSDDVCLDTNECNDATVCSQLCNNTYGSYVCSCLEGYRISERDKKTCIDINECEERTSLCQQDCTNTNGSYNCLCSEGYHLHSDGHHCTLDISKEIMCRVCQQKCSVNQNVVTCGCNNGYKQDPLNVTKCLDINECTEGNMPCSQNCTNTDGHYKCSCYDGYLLDTDGVTCTACKVPHYGQNCNSTCQCGLNGHCDTIRGCVCLTGWTEERCSQDVNECDKVDSCPTGQLCSNTIGSFQCNCPDGYRKQQNGTCTDIDECTDLEVTFKCSADIGERCENTLGSYLCSCKTGFYRNQFMVCEDIDECAIGIADCGQKCENIVGSFACGCYPGYYKAPDRKNCIDVKDICKNQNMTCSHNCSVDANGKPFCFCPRGFELIGSTRCQDINECSSTSLNLCSNKQGCRNIDGGFTCSCPAGQKLDNDNRTCIDCDGNTWGTQCANDCGCSIHADRCDPVTGCVCKTGFNGRYCSEDIDECANGQKQCSTNEICVNKPGGADCQCRNGFSKQNGICSDVDECQDKSLHTCSQNCTNTIGGFICSCYSGYILNSTNHACLDIDECSTDQHQCSDICTNTEGSFRCSCSDGQLLQSDGLSCGSHSQTTPATIPCDLNNKCPAHLQCKNSKCHCFNGLLPDSNGQCIDCNRVLTAPNGTIMSSNYPLNYPDDSNCTWSITANNANSVISISFQEYELEGCPYDYVEVYDGNSRSAKQLGSLCESVPSRISSTGNSMYIVFMSDSSDNLKGFLATYTSEALCRENLCSHTCHVTSTNPWIETCSCPEWMNLDVTGEQCVVTHACNTTIKASSGYIVSPNYPQNYPDKIYCYWTIEASPNLRLKLSFSEFKLESGENCPYDSSSIFDGSSNAAPLLGRYCGTTTPATISTSHNFMHIVFQSDGSTNSKGFKAFFTII